MHLVPGSLRLVNKIGGKMATGKYKTREIQLTGRESGRVELHVWLTNRFQVAVRLFSNWSQMTSKCGKNKKAAHEAQPSVSLMFLPHFDVLCDLLLNRRTVTWNLFVLSNKELKKKFWWWRHLYVCPPLYNKLSYARILIGSHL